MANSSNIKNLHVGSLFDPDDNGREPDTNTFVNGKKVSNGNSTSTLDASKREIDDSAIEIPLSDNAVKVLEKRYLYMCILLYSLIAFYTVVIQI